jgi:uncharacterized repeat protein (TIGR01451 family)
VNGDLLDETNETFFVNLSNAANAAILDPQGVGTITDNDPTPSLSINDLPNIAEGNTGNSTVNFTVTLSAASGQTVTVNYATADGTATTANNDYTAASGTLTFNPGDTTKNVPVTIKGDTVNETDETFFVNLTSPTNATISDSQGQGIIKNDDTSANADMSVTKSAASSIVLAGNNITYTIGVTNNGPDAASNAGWSDTLPANTVFASLSSPPAGWTCITPGINGTGTVNCSVGSLAASASAGFTLTVKVNAGTTVGTIITNTAQVSSATSDNNNTNDSANASVNVVDPNSADLQVTKSDSPDPVDVGSTISYTIILTNNGPQVAANPSMIDNLPAEVNFQSVTPPAGWTCITPAVGGTGQISCNSATSIPVNGTRTFPVTVKVNTNVFDNTVISNTATCSTTTLESVSANNSATSQTTAKGPQLVITQVYPGGGNGGATYTNDFIEIFNRGSRTVDFSVTPYSIQYASVGSNFGGTTGGVKFDLTSGTIAPGRYFLVQGASGGANGVALPTPDATSSISMAAASGKVALVFGTNALAVDDCPGDDNASPFNPNAATIFDFVGYGSTATTAGHCYEGSGPAPFSTSTAGGLDPDARSTIRTSSCTDTNVNSADFSNPTTAPVARNSATTVVTCP